MFYSCLLHFITEYLTLNQWSPTLIRNAAPTALYAIEFGNYGMGRSQVKVGGQKRGQANVIWKEEEERGTAAYVQKIPLSSSLFESTLQGIARFNFLVNE